MLNQASAVDPSLFTKVVEFAGVFRDGELVTKPLSVEIRYSPLNAHLPIGIIRGTAADWPQLESFFHERKSSICELESVSAAEWREKIRATQVLIRQISCRHPYDKSETIQQVLGHFEMWDVTIAQDYEQGDTPNRGMTFLVRGPTLVWMSDAIRSFSYLDSTNTEFPHARLRIPRARDVRIAAQPYFLYASRRNPEPLFFPDGSGGRAPGKPRLSVEGEAFALRLTDRDLDRTDANFETRALEIAEILCPLVSFLSKADVTWYARTFWSDGRLCETYRHIREVPINQLQWQDVVLHAKDIRQFMSDAFTAYERRVNDGASLRLPILLYVAAQSAPTIEEQLS